MKDIKQWQDRFDEKWNYTVAPNKDIIKSFIQSEIDRAVAEERERIMESIGKDIASIFAIKYLDEYNHEMFLTILDKYK